MYAPSLLRLTASISIEPALFLRTAVTSEASRKAQPGPHRPSRVM